VRMRREIVVTRKRGRRRRGNGEVRGGMLEMAFWDLRAWNDTQIDLASKCGLARESNLYIEFSYNFLIVLTNYSYC
jgi:hypothetical protein